MELIKGKQYSAIKVCLYGVEGLGKSTLASQFPRPVFIDTEGSTAHMDVLRTPVPQSWAELLGQVKYFIQHPGELGTLVIDTIDWAEKMCMEQICASKQMNSIEDAGYGRGYVFLAEEFGRFLNLLDDLRRKGIHIVLVAHAIMRKFEQPDEMGAYDRWELKLQKKTAPLVKEWSDMILFANYKTHVINVDGQGAAKGKNKVQGGKRVMYTSHHPSWDAKNRFGLPDEMPFEYGRISHIFVASAMPNMDPSPPPTAVFTTVPEPAPATAQPQQRADLLTPAPPPPAPPMPPVPDADEWVLDEEVPPALAALLVQNRIKTCEIRAAVFERGYFPADMAIKDYPLDFVNGALIGAWPKVLELIQNNRAGVPF